MWHAHDGMGWWMMFGGVMWLALIALLVFGVISVTRSSGRQSSPDNDRESSALEIARQRYARGEIDRDEFDQIRRDLVDDARGDWSSRAT